MFMIMKFTNIQLFNYSKENDTCNPRLYYISIETEYGKKSFFVSCSIGGNKTNNGEILSTKNLTSINKEERAIINLFNGFCLTDFIVELVHPDGIIGKVMDFNNFSFTPDK